MASALTDAGFQVALLLNGTRRSMIEYIQQFSRRARSAVALFYFTGHGAQVDGRKYLIPDDARASSATDLPFEGVAANRLLTHLQNVDTRLNLVILDSCRNTPYKGVFRNAERGLARMDVPPGTIIAYATAAGTVAADGSGQNSPYTHALVTHLRNAREPVEQLFKTVARNVITETPGRRRPWIASNFVGNFAFVRSRHCAGVQ